ncbi:MAG: nucleotidyltransferase family protein [Cylindrospermopsis raciborskii KL1]|jgi:NDP-sugar pyrophosphorylase family protein|uniref:nucleotidyltransferase family protein n=1 Tax=Cylindrospermopsis raciborskii TaxID=77022 RepID=UPI001A19DB18|nr:nucleotidyltransferase family protein [Cylindrospermopsis raciborskii]MBG0744586.1 nucleotidyltransferase family protein [Cylindrospermopsis raciborskii KL1]
MLPVAILAGGLATRLRPITEKIPKALVPVAGKPFIYHQLTYLRDQGIDRVVLCIGYLGQMIQDVVGDGTEFGLSVSYSLDGPVLLGTGGAMKQASHLLEESFFVLYGDSFLPIDFSAVENSFLSSGKPALMTILHNGDRWDKSNVLFRNGKLEEYNKRYPRTEMEFIDYGLGILSKSVFEYYTDYPLDLADVYHSLSLEGNLLGYEVHERFYEIGSIPGLKETETYFLRK